MFAAFMDLEKGYDRVDRQGLWRVWKDSELVDRMFLRVVKYL